MEQNLTLLPLHPVCLFIPDLCSNIPISGSLLLSFSVLCFIFTLFFLCSLSDDLQEQKADIDLFLSAESQPDVTVSSEESVEVPSFKGKPFRPFQVNTLGSQSEPEGKFLSIPVLNLLQFYLLLFYSNFFKNVSLMLVSQEYYFQDFWAVRWSVGRLSGCTEA